MYYVELLGVRITSVEQLKVLFVLRYLCMLIQINSANKFVSMVRVHSSRQSNSGALLRSAHHRRLACAYSVTAHVLVTHSICDI